MIALFSADAELGPLTVLYQSLNESSGIGYVEGGIQLSGYSISTVRHFDPDQGKGITIHVLSFDDPKWETVSVTARGALIYNASKSGKAIQVLDFAENVTSTNDSFTVTLPEQTAKDGLIRIS